MITNEKIKQFEQAASAAVTAVEEEILSGLERKEALNSQIEELQNKIARLRAIEDMLANNWRVRDYARLADTFVERVGDRVSYTLSKAWDTLKKYRTLRSAMFRG